MSNNNNKYPICIYGLYSVFILKGAKLNKSKTTGNTKKYRNALTFIWGGHCSTAME